MTDRKSHHILAVIALAAAVFLAYSNSLGGTWALDDIVARRHVNFTDLLAVAGVRRVAYLTFLVNQYLGPFEPLYYRLINILIHFANTVLVYVLAYKTILLTQKDDGSGGKTRLQPRGGKTAFGTALIAASVFGLHPLNINAVSYIVQRMTSLAAFFSLLALLSYIVGAKARGRTASGVAYALSCLFYIAGVFSKENAIMAVPLVALYDYVFISRFDTGFFRKRFLAIIALSAVTLIFISQYGQLRSFSSDLIGIMKNIGKPFPERSWMAVDIYWTPVQHLLTEFRVVSRYLLLFIAPLPGLLVFDWWSFPVSTGIASPLATLISIAFIAGLVAFAIWKMKRLPFLSFGILWYLVAISLESFFAMGLDLYFEHRNYLPLAGLIMGIVGQIVASSEMRQRTAITVAVIVSLLLGSLTYARNYVWKDSVALWRDAASKNPDNIRALMSLGNAYLLSSDMPDAERSYIKVVQLSGMKRRVNFFNDGAYSLGMIYLMKGELPKAKELIDKFDRIIESYRTKILRGYYHSQSGDYDRAIADYESVMDTVSEGSTDRVVLYTLLGDAYRGKGLSDRAIEYYHKAVAGDPLFSSAYYGIGAAYMAKRDIETASLYYTKTLQLDPENSLALADMADVLLIKKTDPERALEYARRSISQTPFFYQPYLTMANILTVLGREKEAAEFYERAVQHHMPDYMLPYNKARAYYLKGDEVKVRYYLSELRKFRNLPEYIQVVLSRNGASRRS